MEGLFFARFGVGESQLAGVELKLPWARAMAVKGIADDGDTEAFFMESVEAELVGSASNGHKINPCIISLEADFFPMGGAHFTVDLIVNLDRAVIDVQSKRQFDGATFAEAFRQNAVEQGDVTLLGHALVKLAGKVAVCLGGAGNDHQAGGVHIESVHRRLLDAAGEHEFDPVCDAVNFLNAAAWDREHATHLVDHHKAGIGVQDFE